MHGRLVEAGCLVEYNSPGYGAVDCDSEQAAEKALAELNPLLEVGLLIWEWADQAS